MIRFLLTILILFILTTLKAQAQPVVKPQQYKILIKRVVEKRAAPSCLTITYNPPPNVQTYGCSGTEDGSGPGYCIVEDPGCVSCNSSVNKLSIRLSKNGLYSNTDIPDISLANLVAGTPYTYYDTLDLFQPQFENLFLMSDVWENGKRLDVYNPDLECYLQNFGIGFLLNGEYTDLYIPASTPQYMLETYVKVIPNLDLTFTLPSHDKVVMLAEDLNFSATWQYYDSVSNNWQDVPSGFASGINSNTLKISGFDLYGSNYVNYLHSTINFRVRNSTDAIHSAIVPYTLRLSSPHIVSVTPFDLNCFERHEGSMKIGFDRALLPGEKLNILLYDTLNRVNYSALNLSEFAADNSYTWKNELRAGRYFVNLLGKYAKGIEYDITVNTRIDTVVTYLALNSVNFEEGFNTPETDNFNAYTDYTGYSQATYTGAVNHLAFQQLTQPDSIKFAVRVDANVLCKGTASGSVTLAVAGGKDNYKYSIKSQDSDYSAWIPFNNNIREAIVIPTPNGPFFSFSAVKQVITNLTAGTYTIRVRDEVDCFKKDALGNEKSFTFTITEPEKGLTVDLFELSPITSVDSANGKIKIRVSGGSPFPTSGQEIVYPSPYQIEWRDSATNQLLNTYTIDTTNGKFETNIQNLAEGTYIFRLFDRSYNVNDPANAGCFLEMKIPVTKPQPLMVTIRQRHQVSCTGDMDGQLVAKPSGGIPIDSVLYTYKWYKQTAEGNVLLTTTDSLIENLGAGTYLVEITDKYDNKKLSAPFTLAQPAPIQLVFTTTPATCYSSFNGSMGVTVTGGTPFSDPAKAYVYEWSNGAKTATVNNVAGGNYLLVVRDSMSCVAKDTVSVTAPVRVIATAVVNEVSCYDSNNGQIAVTVTGGAAPYTYAWSNGATTATASNLSPGTYWFTVSDANGCFDTDTITLSTPDTLLLSLGADRMICIGQTVRLDATVASSQSLNYVWTGSNAFNATTPKVAIKLPGTYEVMVSNSRGCVMRDTIDITAIDSTINTDFVVSTQAYVNESVNFINISQPKTDSVKWFVPSLGNTVRVLQQNNNKCELIFSDTGRYEITMRAYYRSGCIEDSTKIVNVIKRDGSQNLGSQGNAYLRVYAVVYPNPSDGTFKVQLEFSETTKARLRLINVLTNAVIDDREAQGNKDYLLDYNLGQSVLNGTYILVIDAAKGSFVYKVEILR
jgi:hypothetical protein